ncbi:hypothetical protein SAMN04488570_3150 [Nocardioides scoriae]|uniref:Sortase family protein n=1 Tax=Nocardioides scoriae TaxID=642780 RepID=A0A1H1WFV1_9ACTN|nr:hypothetical protein SAMN04488570_3150 [Nocardioides scoriae]
MAARVSRTARLALVLAAVLVVVAGGTWAGLALTRGSTPAPSSASSGAEPASPSGQPVEPAATLAPPACPSRVTRPFEPTTVTVAGVVRDAAVVTPPRPSPEVPGTPPTTTAGKTVFAFDRAQGVRPGDGRGNVLLNAHTWPDGSALGNRLLEGLREGGRVVLADGDRRLCYRVTDRVEVPADAPYFRYYDRRGPAQVAIVVCSGQRLGPGIWTERTVWFARPSA